MTLYLLLGRLRRDVMALESSSDLSALRSTGQQAVEQGRAAEAYIIPVEDYFSEADVQWHGLDSHVVTAVSPEHTTLPPLNPGSGEQEAPPPAKDPRAPIVTPQVLAEAAAQAAPKGPNTGTNPDGTPTNPATLGEVPAAVPPSEVQTASTGSGGDGSGGEVAPAAVESQTAPVRADQAPPAAASEVPPEGTLVPEVAPATQQAPSLDEEIAAAKAKQDEPPAATTSSSSAPPPT